jgi:hypothetical protein
VYYLFIYLLHTYRFILFINYIYIFLFQSDYLVLTNQHLALQPFVSLGLLCYSPPQVSIYLGLSFSILQFPPSTNAAIVNTMSPAVHVPYATPDDLYHFITMDNTDY